jgi:hypothetical protein
MKTVELSATTVARRANLSRIGGQKDIHLSYGIEVTDGAGGAASQFCNCPRIEELKRALPDELKREALPWEAAFPDAIGRSSRVLS